MYGVPLSIDAVRLEDKTKTQLGSTKRSLSCLLNISYFVPSELAQCSCQHSIALGSPPPGIISHNMHSRVRMYYMPRKERIMIPCGNYVNQDLKL